MTSYPIYWADGSVRKYQGIGSVAVGRIMGVRGCTGTKVADHLKMVDLLLDEQPAPGLSREITVCVPTTQTVH